MNTVRKSLVSTAAVIALAVPVISASGAMADTDDGAATASTWSERTTAEYNAEQQKLAAFLTEHGITNTVETAEGLNTVAFDETDASAWEAVDSFYNQQNPPSAEERQASVNDARELAAYLTSHGITASVVEEDNTLAYVEYDQNDDAAVAAVEDFYWAKSPLDADVLAAANEEASKMVQFLTSQGVHATLDTDRHGVQSVNADWNDDAVQQASMKFWDANPGPLVG